MAITTGASIGDVVDTVIAEARRTQMHRTVMEPLVRTYRVSRGSGDTLEIPKFGTVTAGALTEGVDMTNPQTLATTKVSDHAGRGRRADRDHRSGAAHRA